MTRDRSGNRLSSSFPVRALRAGPFRDPAGLGLFQDDGCSGLGIASRQFAYGVLHPGRQRAEAFQQVFAYGIAVHRICQQLAQLAQNSWPVRGQGVFQPVQGLHDTHRWPAGPVQAAGRRLLELDDEVVQLYGPAPGVGVDRDAGGHRVGQAKIVRRGHAVDQEPKLIPTGDGVYDGAIVGAGGAFREAVDRRPVVQPSVDAPQFAVTDQALQRLVDGVAVTEGRKVRRHPDVADPVGFDKGQDSGFKVGHGCPMFVVVLRTFRKFLSEICSLFRTNKYSLHVLRSEICSFYRTKAILKGTSEGIEWQRNAAYSSGRGGNKSATASTETPALAA